MQDKALPAPVEQAIEAVWPAEGWRDVNVLVGVSGGADSVALLRALVAIKRVAGGRGELLVGHFDHRQRGAASADDAAWVARLGEDLGLRVMTGAADTDGPASEERLRTQRRAFLINAAERAGARWIATGHHADDQAETVLFRVLRGTGLDGLCGIPAISRATPSVCFVRPLLTSTRQELRAYLTALGQDHRHDATNDQTDATRNWLRQELLPLACERFGPGVPAALNRLAEHALEATQAIAAQADSIYEACRVKVSRGAELRLRGLPLGEVGPGVRVDVLRSAWRHAGFGERAMTAEHWRVLEEWAIGDLERLPNLPGGVAGKRDGDWLVLAATNADGLP
ncbi:MAG: tRNA lysidine(34) synthetase TilS [Planctomycetota bacterium]